MCHEACGQSTAVLMQEAERLGSADGRGALPAGSRVTSSGRLAERFIRDLARTPGAMLVRVSWHTVLRGGVAAEGVKVRISSHLYSAETLPERLAAPEDADEVSVTLTGTIKPARAVRTPEDLRAEIDAMRRHAGLEPLPDAPQGAEVGADDVGFLTYQLRFASPVSPGM